MSEEERWDKFDDEYLEFGKVEDKRSNRADLHAFMLLDELFPAKRDIVCHAEHDEIWLAFDDKHSKKLTDDQILELTRRGVRFDSDGFRMFT